MRDVAREAFVAGRYRIADLIHVSGVDEPRCAHGARSGIAIGIRPPTCSRDGASVPRARFPGLSSPLALNDQLAGKYAAAAVSTVSLWKHSDFLKLWTGQTVSRLGTVVTRTALPLVALLTLGAGPPELAFLVISSSAGTLLVGLLAGAWVDRLRRRPILVWADVIRAALLIWIPIAYAIGALAFGLVDAVTCHDAAQRSMVNE